LHKVNINKSNDWQTNESQSFVKSNKHIDEQ